VAGRPLVECAEEWAGSQCHKAEAIGAAIDRLLDLADTALAPSVGQAMLDRARSTLGPAADALVELLARCNGFNALDDSLVVRPLSAATPPRGVFEWNSVELWKRRYPIDCTGLICFAEDLFSNQFALSDHGVLLLEVEQGECRVIAGSLDGWASWLLADSDVRTGRLLASAWKERFGALGSNRRLVPRQPFVLGGSYDIENLVAIDELEAVRIVAGVAAAVRGLKDGQRVRIELPRHGEA
jgi:hypothetical protein